MTEKQRPDSVTTAITDSNQYKTMAQDREAKSERFEKHMIDTDKSIETGNYMVGMDIHNNMRAHGSESIAERYLAKHGIQVSITNPAVSEAIEAWIKDKCKSSNDIETDRRTNRRSEGGQ